jgi:hypothetical protein
MYKYIMVNFYCNDPFIINMITTWIPLWYEKDYNISDTEERPHKDLISEIGNITTKLHLNCQWLSEKSPEMINISNLTDQSLDKLKS